jgi:hypothetical protein
MLKVSGVDQVRFEIALDPHTPFDLRAAPQPAVVKVLSLSDDGGSVATIGLSAEGRLAYVTLAAFGGELEASTGVPDLPTEGGAPRIDLAALGFSEGYETLSRTVPLTLAAAPDGFWLSWSGAPVDQRLSAGAVDFLLADEEVVGAALGNLSAEARAGIETVLRWTAAESAER